MNKQKVLYFESCYYRLELIKKLEICFDVIQLKEISDIGYLPRELEKEIIAMILPVDRENAWSTQHSGGISRALTEGDAYPNLKYILVNQTNPLFEVPENIELISLRGREIRNGLTATAEHTIGLITRLHRSRGAPKKMLSRSKLLIIGHGRLGKMVEERAKPLFREVECLDNQITPGAYQKSLLYSDFCSLHADTNVELIDWPEFFALGKDGYLINTARPELVSIQKANSAVDRGIIAGFASDVDDWTKPEQAPKCMLTNHIGGSTQDSWYLTQEYVIDELIACT